MDMDMDCVNAYIRPWFEDAQGLALATALAGRPALWIGLTFHLWGRSQRRVWNGDWNLPPHLLSATVDCMLVSTGLGGVWLQVAWVNSPQALVGLGPMMMPLRVLLLLLLLLLPPPLPLPLLVVVIMARVRPYT